jgi:hypothetical protein
MRLYSESCSHTEYYDDDRLSLESVGSQGGTSESPPPEERDRLPKAVLWEQWRCWCYYYMESPTPVLISANMTCFDRFVFLLLQQRFQCCVYSQIPSAMESYFINVHSYFQVQKTLYNKTRCKFLASQNVLGKSGDISALCSLLRFGSTTVFRYASA